MAERDVPAPDASRAFALATRGVAARAVMAAVHLGLPDLVKDGPRTLAGLARAAGAHEPSLARLLRALCVVGAVRRLRDGTFGPTGISEGLRLVGDGSVPAMFAAAGGSDAHWADLAESVRIGGPAFEQEKGCSFFEYLMRYPAEAVRFDAGMARASIGHAASVLRVLDFNPHVRVIDVGGGTGAFLGSLLAAVPHLRGVLFEAPHVAARVVVPPDVNGRLEAVAGDFREGVPAGGDLYFLKAVLHDWPDDVAARVLHHCARALGHVPDGRVAVIEMCLPAAGRTGRAIFTDLDLMAITGGRERQRREYRNLMASAGLTSRVIETDCGFCIIEGRRSSRKRG